MVLPFIVFKHMDRTALSQNVVLQLERGVHACKAKISDVSIVSSTVAWLLEVILLSNFAIQKG